jgi:hypothetical protein
VELDGHVSIERDRVPEKEEEEQLGQEGLESDEEQEEEEGQEGGSLELLSLPPRFFRIVETPPTRSILTILLDVVTGSVQVLSLSRMAPGCQPAFDSVGGVREGTRTRTLSHLASAATTELRQAQHVPPHPALMHLELTNDAVLTGRSLSRLVNPALPLAIVI